MSLKRDVAYGVKNQNQRNVFCYEPLLQHSFAIPIEISLPPIIAGGLFKETYHPMTFSLTKTEWGYKAIVGAVNYTQIGEKEIHTIDRDGRFRIRNFFLSLDRELRILDQREILEALPRKKFPSLNREGISDCRPFEWAGEDYFICTTNDTNPIGQQQVSVAKLSRNGNQSVMWVEALTPLLGRDPHLEEKNWLPFLSGDQLKMISLYDPLTLSIPDLQTGECKEEAVDKHSYDLSIFQGSAGPIEWDGGYLALVHEAVRFPDGISSYLHRFLFFNTFFQIEKISDPFMFLHQGVERCSSMVINHAETDLILPFTKEDREVYLCFLPMDQLKALLHAIYFDKSTDCSTDPRCWN